MPESFEPRKWTRHPKLDEAEQVTTENTLEIAKWCGGVVDASGLIKIPNCGDDGGHGSACLGDWIVRVPTGEFYILSNHAFNRVYQPGDVTP